MLALAGFLLACAKHPLVDLDLEGPHEEGSPRIIDVRYIGQSEYSNSVLNFEVDLEKPENTMIQGWIDIFIVGATTSHIEQDLGSIFLRNEVDPKSGCATIIFPVELNFSGENSRFAFQIEFQLRNLQGQVSNRPKMRFVTE